MRARWFRTAVIFGGIALTTGCGEPGGAQAGACPPDCQKLAAAAPNGAVLPGAFLVAPAPPAPVDANAWSPESVRPLLEDPRLAAVLVEVSREQFPTAGALMARAVEGLAPNAPERAAWLYQLGKLKALGGNPTAAAAAFEASASAGGTLADFARLSAAQWLVGLGKNDEAMADARLVGDDAALASALDLVVADASIGKGDPEGGIEHLRRYLARDKHPSQWVAIALRLCGLLREHPTEAHAEETITLARRVMDESPGGAGGGAAKELEQQALASLPFDKRKRFESATAEERVARGRALVGSFQGKEAIAMVAKVLDAPHAEPASGKKHKKKSKAKHAVNKEPGASAEVLCEAHLVEADAYKSLRKKPEAVEAYARAVDACDKSPKKPEALFNAGRSLAQAGRAREAMLRYAALEKEFPKHRLADDARLKGALAALDANDEPAFTDLLTRMPDDYPDGDMVNDGLFALALARIEKGDWSGAVLPLERAEKIVPRELAYWAAGRTPYFLARAHLALGEVAAGRAELAQVMRDHPLSFYMALAYSRLAEKDRAGADRVLGEAIAKEPQGRFALPRGAWLDDPIFVRAVELAREGEAKLVKGELDRLGVGARTAPRDVMWAAAFLLSTAGSPTMSHAVLRSANASDTPKAGELTEWLGHYPSGVWQAPWALAFPRPFEAVVAPAAQKEHLPEAWAHAIMREESAFDARVVSPAKAYGLMQLIVPTAKRMGQPIGIQADEESLKHPETNVPLGCRYLTFLRGMFPDNPLLAIPGYNAGGNAPKKWLSEHPADDFDVWVERIPYEETRNYTKRVVTSLAAYEFIYGKDQPSEALHMPLAASPSARAGAPMTLAGDDAGE